MGDAVCTNASEGPQKVRRERNSQCLLVFPHSVPLADAQSLDFNRLVPFVLILIVIEEILPLIVIYAPFMLPSTTILPSQAERIYNKREEKKIQTLTTAKWYAGLEGLDSSALRTVDVKALSNDLAWTVCRYALVVDDDYFRIVAPIVTNHYSELSTCLIVGHALL